MTKTAVEARTISKHFGQGENVVKALDNVSVSIGQGEFFTLLGPSGCGKTTLLRMIAGFESPTSGQILLDGQDITDLPPNKRPVNTVFQSYALFPHLTVAQNIAFGLEMLGKPRAEVSATTERMLALVKLEKMAGRKISQLSGGQQQRIALARSIIARPRLLLLDEPLSALDRNLRQQMQLELKTLQHSLGIAFIFVTHDQEEALTMSDRIVVMRAGRIEQIGTPRDIYRKPKNRFVAEFIGETNLFAVTIDRIEGAAARAVTAEGVELYLPAQGRKPGEQVTAILRPADFTLAGNGIAGTVSRAVYLGADLYLFVRPLAGGPEIRVIARDGAGFDEGANVHLAHDPARVHVLEGA